MWAHSDFDPAVQNRFLCGVALGSRIALVGIKKDGLHWRSDFRSFFAGKTLFYSPVVSCLFLKKRNSCTPKNQARTGPKF